MREKVDADAQIEGGGGTSFAINLQIFAIFIV